MQNKRGAGKFSDREQPSSDALARTGQPAGRVVEAGVAGAGIAAGEPQTSKDFVKSLGGWSFS